MAMLNMIDDMFMKNEFSKYPLKTKFEHKTDIPQRRSHEIKYLHQVTT